MKLIQQLLRRFFNSGGVTGRVHSGPEQVDAVLHGLYEQGKIPGLAIQVNREEKVLLRAGIGMAHMEEGIPVQAEKTVFRIASVSKPITAIALARMVANGLMDLEDPLQKYVPEYPQKGIRIRHLASHTAGIRGYKGKEYAMDKPLDIEGGMQLFLNDPLVFKPGKGYLYNSFDSVLLSLAMERAAAMPFADFVKRQVLEPLGMDHTFVEVPGQPVPGQAICYTRFAGGFRRAAQVDNRYKLAGGGYLSTVGDLCRMGAACLNAEIVPEHIQNRFISPQIIKGKSTWYGLGWQLGEDIPGYPYYGHIGNGVGAYSNFFVYPRQRMVVSILINCTDPKVQPELNEAIGALPDFYSFQQ